MDRAVGIALANSEVMKEDIITRLAVMKYVRVCIDNMSDVELDCLDSNDINALVQRALSGYQKFIARRKVRA